MSGRSDREDGTPPAPGRAIDERLADWVDGRLGDREREKFLAELRVSPQLRADLADYERTVAALRAALRAPTRPVDLRDRVLAAIAAGRQAPAPSPPWTRHPIYWSLAAAAALLVFAVWLNSLAPAAPKTDAVVRHEELDKLVREQLAAAAPAPAAAEERAPVTPDAAAVTAGLPRQGAPPPVAATTAPPAPAPTAVPEASGRQRDAGRLAADPPPESRRAAVETPGAAPPPAAGGEPLRHAAPAEEPAAAENREATGNRPGVENRLETGNRLPTAPGAPANQRGGAADDRADADPSRRARGGRSEPPRDGYADEETAGKAGADVPAPGRAAARSASGRGAPAPVPVVSIGGPAAAPAPAGPAGPATGGAAPDSRAKQASAAPAIAAEGFLAFLKQQVAAPADESAAEKKFAERAAGAVGQWRAGLTTVSLLPLDAPGPGDRTLDAKDRAEARADAAAAGDRHWLVEGSRAEVAELLRRVAEFAQRSGLPLANGELAADDPLLASANARDAGLPAAATPGAAAADPATKPGAPAGGAGAGERMRLVLRFRVAAAR